MKKKTLCLASLSTFLCLGMAYISNNNAPIHTHAEGEKKTVYFNITNEIGMDANRNLFHFNTDLDSFPSNVSTPQYNYYYNNELRTSPNAVSVEGGQILFIYAETDTPSTVTENNTNYYSHYKIKAGTIIFSDDTANYVLEKDYNFWSTRGQNIGFNYIFQHGGNDHWGSTTGLTNGNINSLKFTSFGGGVQDFAKRFLFQPSYEETSDAWTYANMGWQQRCPIFIDKGNGYVLSADSSCSAMTWENGMVQNNNEQLLFSLYNKDIFGSATEFSGVTMDSSYYSFYIPDGTLWGGLDHPFMIEGDYYFEITRDPVNNTFWHGFYSAPHDYEKHEAKEATCKEEGNIEYYTCDRDTHGGTEYFVLKDGVYVSTTKEAVILGCTDHKFKSVDKVEPTTGKHGVEAHYECSTCDTLFSSDNKDSVVTLDSLIIHDYVKHDAKKSTCEEEGNVEYYTCSACDKYFVLNDGNYNETTLDKIKINPSHKYGNEIALVEASELIHGLKAHYQCQDCHKLFVKDNDGKYIETSNDDLIIHHIVDVDAKEASCTESGIKAHKKCTCEGCNKLYILDSSNNLKETSESAITTSPLGHLFGEWTFDETNMKISQTCSRCNKVITVDVNEENGFVYKVIKESTSTTNGIATWTHAQYGTFTVKLPLNMKNYSPIFIVGFSLGVGVIIIGVGICLFFIIKKKKA